MLYPRSMDKSITLCAYVHYALVAAFAELVQAPDAFCRVPKRAESFLCNNSYFTRLIAQMNEGRREEEDSIPVLKANNLNNLRRTLR